MTGSLSRSVIWKSGGRENSWGARQSGQAMLRFADLEKDGDLIEKAASLAEELLNGKLPDSDTIISKHLARWLDYREEYLNV